MALELDPSTQLIFPVPTNGSSKESITLRNSNSSLVGFKVKTTAPKSFFVKPHYGTIKPGESVVVKILFQLSNTTAPASSTQFLQDCKDRLMVQSLVMTGVDLSSTSFNEAWNAIEPKLSTNFFEYKLKCSFDVPPPYSSSSSVLPEISTAPPAGEPDSLIEIRRIRGRLEGGGLSTDDLPIKAPIMITSPKPASQVEDDEPLLGVTASRTASTLQLPLNPRDKPKDREREQERDRDREKERDREQIREQDRERDRERERDQERERDNDREKEHERDHERERDRDRNRDREKEREREYERDPTMARSGPSRRSFYPLCPLCHIAMAPYAHCPMEIAPCGHSLCLNCTWDLLDRNLGIICPFCNIEGYAEVRRVPLQDLILAFTERVVANRWHWAALGGPFEPPMEGGTSMLPFTDPAEIVLGSEGVPNLNSQGSLDIVNSESGPGSASADGPGIRFVGNDSPYDSAEPQKAFPAVWFHV